MTRKITKAKTCGECGKGIREWNKSGLCNHHYTLKTNKRLRKKRQEEGLCPRCGKKVEPIIKYPAEKTIPPVIKYTIHCYDCRVKYRKYFNEVYMKKRLTTKNEKKEPRKSPVSSRRTKAFRARRGKNKLCIGCGSKVKAIITYPAGDTIPPVRTIPSRCYPCRIRRDEYNKKYQAKQLLKKEVIASNIASVTTL